MNTPAGDVVEEARRVLRAIAAAPKSMRWRARARIGRRMAWYEIPEEHVRGG